MGSQLDEAKIRERFRLSERELKKLRWHKVALGRCGPTPKEVGSLLRDIVGVILCRT